MTIKKALAAILALAAVFTTITTSAVTAGAAFASADYAIWPAKNVNITQGPNGGRELPTPLAAVQSVKTQATLPIQPALRFIRQNGLLRSPLRPADISYLLVEKPARLFSGRPLHRSH